MAKRDSNFRKDVLDLDAHECQKCGESGDGALLQAHHVVPRASGGIPSRDDPANGITFCLMCHKKVEDKVWRIVRWDRSDQKNGLVMERKIRVEGLDENQKKTSEISRIPFLQNKLWFYLKQHKAQLQHEVEMLGGLNITANARAGIFLHVLRYSKVIAPEMTPEAFLASLGHDTETAKDEAAAAEWIEEHGLEWIDGVNRQKIDRIMEATAVRHATTEQLQSLIHFARDNSLSNLNAELERNGFPWEATGGVNLYARIPRAGVEWIMAGSDAGIERKPDTFLVKVQRTFPPLSRRRGKLLIRDVLIEREVEVERPARRGNED